MLLGEGHCFGMQRLRDRFNLNLNKWPIHPRGIKCVLWDGREVNACHKGLC